MFAFACCLGAVDKAKEKKDSVVRSRSVRKSGRDVLKNENDVVGADQARGAGDMKLADGNIMGVEVEWRVYIVLEHRGKDSLMETPAGAKRFHWGVLLAPRPKGMWRKMRMELQGLEGDAHGVGLPGKGVYVDVTDAALIDPRRGVNLNKEGRWRCRVDNEWDVRSQGKVLVLVEFGMCERIRVDEVVAALEGMAVPRPHSKAEKKEEDCVTWTLRGVRTMQKVGVVGWEIDAESGGALEQEVTDMGNKAIQELIKSSKEDGNWTPVLRKSMPVRQSMTRIQSLRRSTSRAFSRHTSSVSRTAART